MYGFAPQDRRAADPIIDFADGSLQSRLFGLDRPPQRARAYLTRTLYVEKAAGVVFAAGAPSCVLLRRSGDGRVVESAPPRPHV